MLTLTFGSVPFCSFLILFFARRNWFLDFALDPGFVTPLVLAEGSTVTGIVEGAVRLLLCGSAGACTPALSDPPDAYKISFDFWPRFQLP
jgi:hypothetical protein